jgi:hypothetical protein
MNASVENIMLGLAANALTSLLLAAHDVRSSLRLALSAGCLSRASALSFPGCLLR